MSRQEQPQDAISSPSDEHQTYQIQDTSRMRLVFDALGEKQKPLAGLTCMSDVMFSHLRFLTLEVIRQHVRIEGLIAEPEELFGKPETPNASG